MIGQLSRFAGVGAIATAVHVLVAMLAAEGFGWAPQIANFAGFAAAVTVSYLGHGRFTFGTRLEHRTHAPRFLISAGLGLGLSGLITQVIAVWFAAPFALAMAVVAVAVPMSSFLLFKFWVFTEPQPDGP